MVDSLVLVKRHLLAKRTDRTNPTPRSARTPTLLDPKTTIAGASNSRWLSPVGQNSPN